MLRSLQTSSIRNPDVVVQSWFAAITSKRLRRGQVRSFRLDRRILERANFPCAGSGGCAVGSACADRGQDAEVVAMRLTIIHPCIGRRPGVKYVRTWQMEPLPAATLAGLTPADIAIRFYDDRLEKIPFDEPADLVAISVETYTARRAYQIASEYRSRGVPVVMGGFHATLGNGRGRSLRRDRCCGRGREHLGRADRRLSPRPSAKGLSRSAPTVVSESTAETEIFRGKRYLPVALVEAGRGCHFHCDFCRTKFLRGHAESATPG